MNKLKFLFYTTLIFLQCYSQQAGVSNFTTEDYNAHYQNWAILQASDSRIFAGNHTGLLIYNGQKWQKLQIPNYTVRSIATNHKGEIFIGGLNTFGSLRVQENGLLDYVDLSEQLDSTSQNFGNIWKIKTVGNKTYFNSFDNIYVLENKKLSSLNTGRILYSFVVNNSLYFQKRSNYELYKVSGTGFEAISNKDFQSMYVMAMNEFDGKILISTYQNASFLYYGDSIEPYPSEIDQYLITSKINDAASLKNKTIAFATRKKGVVNYNFESKKALFIDENNFLQNNNVKSLNKENNNSIWLTLNKGISRVNFKPNFQKVNLESTLNTMLSFNGKLILGTFKGLRSLEKESLEVSKLGNVNSAVWGIISFNESLLIASEEGIYESHRSDIKKVNSDFTSFMHMSKLYENTIIYSMESTLFTMRYYKKKWQLRKQLVKFNADVHGWSL
jgi:ligand-binding sensor domain-containing protein